MAAIALLVRVVQPGWRTICVALLTKLSLPVCALVAAGIGVASVSPAAPGETDASGIVIAVCMMMGAFAAFWMIVLGMPASWAALHVIPNPVDHDACAHSRCPMDIMRQG